MREQHLVHLCCPKCRSDLRIGNVERRREDRIEAGSLACTGCDAVYPVVDSVPRFVPRENYASSFGLEWTRHARTQYDGQSGVPLSERRFFAETRWPRRLEGELILEAGSGSGRFTEHAAATGATIVSVDYSYAVEANQRTNGHLPNVLIVQGDIRALPLREAQFDRIFCFGVLQHTPDPRAAFECLVRHLKPGGNLVVDLYIKSFAKVVLGTKYWVRPLTRRMPPHLLYRCVRRYTDFMWPLAAVIRKVPRIGPALNWRLLVADYSRDGVPEALLKDWAVLDTFDMLAPRYDSPQTVATVRRWFAAAGLTDIQVGPGYNGVEARGSLPLPQG